VDLAKKAKVPVAVHLDHGKDPAIIRKCIAVGFNSIMFDGSELSFEDNVCRTKEIVEYCHNSGVFVEGEVWRNWR
jgi:fructose/tagatose bisphosphate aldolase